MHYFGKSRGRKSTGNKAEKTEQIFFDKNHLEILKKMPMTGLEPALYC
jgi:hypothetical protein